MDEQQPKALKLAHWLESNNLARQDREVATELRRLHVVELEAIALRAQIERLQAEAQGAKAKFANLSLDIHRVLNWEKPLNGFDEIKELQDFVDAQAERLQAAGQVVAYQAEWSNGPTWNRVGLPQRTEADALALLADSKCMGKRATPLCAAMPQTEVSRQFGFQTVGNEPPKLDWSEPAQEAADTGAEGRELMTKLHAQIRHLIDDLTTVVEDEGLTRYVTAHGGGMIYSNFINALIPLAKQLGAALAARAGQVAAPAMVPHEPNAKLLELADRIDHEKLWRLSGIDQMDLPQEKRDRVMAAVNLRRYADLLGNGGWRIFPPRPGFSFRADSLDAVIAMARKDEVHHGINGLTVGIK